LRISVVVSRESAALIEAVMVFGLGFLVASLMALLTLPALSRRAARLARRRIEAQFPLSLAEIAAERDHLRAEMAVETRKIELKNEAIRHGKAQDMIELGRRAVAMVKLEDALSAKSADLSRSEESLAAVRAELENRTQDLLRTTAELDLQTLNLAQRQEALSVLQADYAKVSHLADERRISIAALETSGEGYRARILEVERELQVVTSRLSQQATLLEETQTKAAVLAHKLAVANETAQAREIAWTKLGAEHDRLQEEVAMLRTQAEEAAAAMAGEHLEKVEIEAALDRLKADFDTITRDYATSLDHLRAEKAAVTGALETARGDRDRLDKEVKALNRRLKAGGPDRAGNDAMLRREIERVGSEILRLIAASTPAPPVAIDERRETKPGAVPVPDTANPDKPTSSAKPTPSNKPVPGNKPASGNKSASPAKPASATKPVAAVKPAPHVKPAPVAGAAGGGSAKETQAAAKPV
jgi:hypothetical protein